MSKRIRTEITIETERTVTIHLRQSPFVVWCDECMAHVPAVTSHQAASLLQVSADTLQRLLQSQQLHLVEECEGLLLICLRTLYHRH